MLTVKNNYPKPCPEASTTGWTCNNILQHRHSQGSCFLGKPIFDFVICCWITFQTLWNHLLICKLSNRKKMQLAMLYFITNITLTHFVSVSKFTSVLLWLKDKVLPHSSPSPLLQLHHRTDFLIKQFNYFPMFPFYFYFL